MSPYLFLLCAEGLSCLLKKELDGRLLSGIQISPHSPKISHLFFADGTFLFAKAFLEETQIILAVLKIYENASGQQINLDKTQVFLSPNTPSSIRCLIERSFHIRRGAGCFRYLGYLFLVVSRKLNISNTSKIIWTKLKGWKEKFLSKRENEVLSKAVARSIPTYTMSCF